MFKSPFSLMVKTVSSWNHSRSLSAARRGVKWFDIIEMITRKCSTSQVFEYLKHLMLKDWCIYKRKGINMYGNTEGKLRHTVQNELFAVSLLSHFPCTSKKNCILSFGSKIQSHHDICSVASLTHVLLYILWENSFCIWNFFSLNSLQFITCCFGGGVTKECFWLCCV